jgi:hypothetical protein
VPAGRGGKEDPAVGQDPVGLGNGGRRVGQVVEDVDGHGGVHGPGADRQGGGVGLDHRGWVAGQHGRRGVQPDQPRLQVSRQGGPQRPLAAADVQDPPGVELGEHLGQARVQAA